MRSIFQIVCWLLPVFVMPQASVTVLNENSKDQQKAVTPATRTELFTSGFIDILNNGQVNASARLVRLFIGEPYKFAIPVSLYGGVSANNFQPTYISIGAAISNNHLVNQFINPLCGIVNVLSDGVLFFAKGSSKQTKTGWVYQLGERILTGYKSQSVSMPDYGEPVNFLNSYANSGLYLQTGAWERNNDSNSGICWMALRYHLCYSHPRQIREFLPIIETNGIYSGYSLAFGVEVSQVVNLKVLYYEYIKKPGIDYALPIYQFSFNYSLTN